MVVGDVERLVFGTKHLRVELLVGFKVFAIVYIVYMFWVT